MADYIIKLAQTKKEKEEAYQLRYEVFLNELGQGIQPLCAQKIETDIYDRWCDHLIVVDKSNNMTVGTYRLLPGRNAYTGAGFYSEKIFDIDKIKGLGKDIAEVGRSCVHKDYREGLIISLLWKGIADYIKTNNTRYLFGSVRLYTTDPGEITEIFGMIKEKYYSAQHLRVVPKKESVFEGLNPQPEAASGKETFLKLPALLKGYLRLGMKVCGEPAWDRHLESVVFFIMLDVNEMTPSYRTHFFEP